MLIIVIECVTSSDAFDGGTSERTETFCRFIVFRTKDFAEVVGKKLAKLASGRGRNRPHRHSPSKTAADLLQSANLASIHDDACPLSTSSKGVGDKQGVTKTAQPAVGTDAAANSQDFGTSRWRLYCQATSTASHAEEALAKTAKP
jgi:hypothetical protein